MGASSRPAGNKTDREAEIRVLVFAIGLLQREARHLRQLSGRTTVTWITCPASAPPARPLQERARRAGLRVCIGSRKRAKHSTALRRSSLIPSNSSRAAANRDWARSWLSPLGFVVNYSENNQAPGDRQSGARSSRVRRLRRAAPKPWTLAFVTRSPAARLT